MGGGGGAAGGAGAGGRRVPPALPPGAERGGGGAGETEDGQARGLRGGWRRRRRRRCGPQGDGAVATEIAHRLIREVDPRLQVRACEISNQHVMHEGRKMEIDKVLITSYAFKDCAS